ncbi:hypothetical protein JVT61DRAFT_1750 [Boletus reticuloceps]|uniref:Uncharacterized protein n=1 Tax=Boletus reticuloceps TaxID=495285 RepID=A0A8I2YU07_9AGAM|nr:hypothetical protein JVT61DRAFT_1750 [Boletus reticuloceps]
MTKSRRALPTPTSSVRQTLRPTKALLYSNPSDALRVPLTSIQVFTFQGHFEFTESIVRQLIPELADELGPELVEDGLLRIGTPTDAIDKVGRVIWGMLGVTAERDNVRTGARL